MKKVLAYFSAYTLLVFSFISGNGAFSSTTQCPPSYETIPAINGLSELIDEKTGQHIGWIPIIICGADVEDTNSYCCIKIKIQ